MQKSSSVTWPKLLKAKWLFRVALLLLILFAWFMAYQPVMFNFFTSDDFYFISKLHQVKHNSMLLLRGMDEGTPYYRPFLYVILFGEYLLTGANAFFMRITSLFLELLTAVVFSLLLSGLAQNHKDRNQDKFVFNWCLFTAGLFLLYPLHTEPVNWFICTNDLLANFFALASFLLYIWWRQGKSLAFEFGSCSLAALAYLTKESTVTLPLIITAYEMLIRKPDSKSNSSLPARSKYFFKTSTLYPTSLHWVFLAIYFIARKIATGYFLANQADISFCFPDKNTMLRCWTQSLKMILLPVSINDSSYHQVLYHAWEIIIISLIVLSIYTAIKSRADLKLMIFIMTWFFICFLPMLGFFIITPELLNARYGYLASVPLCFFLTYGLAALSVPQFISYIRYPIFTLIAVISCILLRTNNSAWADTGRLTNNLLREFHDIHELLGKEDFRIYFVNIPDVNKGVAVNGLRFIESMNRAPFSQKTFNNGVWLKTHDQVLPIGIMERDLERGNIFAHFYYWCDRDQHFHPVDFPKEEQVRLRKTTGRPYEIVNNIYPLGSAERQQNDNPTFLFKPKSLLCFPVDLIVIKVHLENNLTTRAKPIAELNYSNNAQESLLDTNRLIVPLDISKRDQSIFFILRGTPIWSFGGKCKTIQLSFPKDCNVKIAEAYADSIKYKMPQIKILGPGYDKDTGRFELCDEYPQSTIRYDASLIKNCAGVVLEAIGPGKNFNQLNSDRSDNSSLIDLSGMSPVGELKIGVSQFKESGLYKVRLRPIDKEGSQVGFCSDHFLLNVKLPHMDIK